MTTSRIRERLDGSLYKSRPLERALKDEFSSQSLFGSASPPSGPNVKIAVSAAPALQQQPVVFASYNRPDRPEKCIYQFTRADTPSEKIKIWEAARAALAKPPYFKPFHKREFGSQYVDGSLHHSCPARIAHHEAQCLWNDVVEADILLSLGTGSRASSQSSASLSTQPSSRASALSTSSSAAKAWDVGELCERQWDKFAAGREHSDPATSASRPNPPFDAAAAALERAVHAVLQRPGHTAALRAVVRRLVAGAFFFAMTPGWVHRPPGEDGYICTYFARGGLTPAFVIGGRADDDDDEQELELEVRVLRHGHFDVGKRARKRARIALRLGAKAAAVEDFPVSGFPGWGWSPSTPPSRNRDQRLEIGVSKHLSPDVAELGAGALPHELPADTVGVEHATLDRQVVFELEDMELGR
ncbi:hypothetical protein F4780DRAFT_775738 [Xylariomycetidae sp. FL0641]|nr:hypothetical protein F4780DRAFT_775738 [Xylariomycetidae sp. FL0641]